MHDQSTSLPTQTFLYYSTSPSPRRLFDQLPSAICHCAFSHIAERHCFEPVFLIGKVDSFTLSTTSYNGSCTNKSIYQQHSQSRIKTQSCQLLHTSMCRTKGETRATWLPQNRTRMEWCFYQGTNSTTRQNPSCPLKDMLVVLKVKRKLMIGTAFRF